MKNIEAVRYKNRLDDLFKKTKLIADLEIQSHWSRYLCILVSGFLEISIPAIFVDYTNAKSSQNVYNYVSNNLELRNPNMERIIQLAYKFSNIWGEALKKETEGRIKTSIDSIFGNRNLLAHGNDTSISYHRISEWYEDAVLLINKLEYICENI